MNNTETVETLLSAAKELSLLINCYNARLKKNISPTDLDEPDYMDMQTCHELQVIAKQLKDADSGSENMNFKLTIHPAIEAGNSWEIYRFETKAELKAASETASCLLLFMQDKAKIMDDYSNMFIEEELIDNEWSEIEECK